mmetsp:Transcript_37851/g.93918  ORF Transcript_37851/g.93918 Transcript_37851/m.93918 type:complete len:237 (-) Transcript_37851:101-811(-)
MREWRMITRAGGSVCLALGAAHILYHAIASRPRSSSGRRWSLNRDISLKSLLEPDEVEFVEFEQLDPLPTAPAPSYVPRHAIISAAADEPTPMQQISRQVSGGMASNLRDVSEASMAAISQLARAQTELVATIQRMAAEIEYLKRKADGRPPANHGFGSRCDTAYRSAPDEVSPTSSVEKRPEQAICGLSAPSSGQTTPKNQPSFAHNFAESPIFPSALTQAGGSGDGGGEGAGLT